MVPVIQHHNGLLVSAGSRYIAPELTNEVVLDLAGYADRQCTITGPTPLSRTQAYQTFTRVQLNWLDMDIPDVYPRFWTGLLDDIVEGRHNLVIMCMGGHGRTGTALAIVAALLGAIPTNECPVRWIRDHYCEEAVETTAQARYITTVTGREVTTKITSINHFSPLWEGVE